MPLYKIPSSITSQRLTNPFKYSKLKKIRFASLKPAKRIAQCFVYMSRDDRARTDDLRNVTAAL